MHIIYKFILCILQTKFFLFGIVVQPSCQFKIQSFFFITFSNIKRQILKERLKKNYGFYKYSMYWSDFSILSKRKSHSVNIHICKSFRTDYVYFIVEITVHGYETGSFMYGFRGKGIETILDFVSRCFIPLKYLLSHLLLSHLLTGYSEGGIWRTQNSL